MRGIHDRLKYGDDTLPPLERIEPDIARQLKAEKKRRRKDIQNDGRSQSP
jgi:hypothetical protein